jgi:hypothetical protein
MDQQKRREEIEAKRARLAELKRQRELRTQEIRSSRQSAVDTEVGSQISRIEMAASRPLSIESSKQTSR